MGIVSEREGDIDSLNLFVLYIYIVMVLFAKQYIQTNIQVTL